MTNRQFTDDPTIQDGDRLFHRVHLSLIVPGERGEARISSGLFKGVKKTEMSVVIESVLTSGGRSPEDCLRGHPLYKLVALTAGICRQNRQAVAPDPTADEPAHGVVYGRKTGAIADALRSAATWVVPGEAPRYADIERERQSGQL